MSRKIVARATSKKGGKCAECRKSIPPGGRIVKISADGNTTRSGNGPGKWVCSACSWQYDDASV